MTLTYDLDLQSHASYGHDLSPHSIQNFKVSGQSVPKIEWKQTDRRTDGRTNGGDCIRPTSHANVVGNNEYVHFFNEFENVLFTMNVPTNAYCTH